MGPPKQKWTQEEEDALRGGVLKHGTGKWRNIQRDPEFGPILSSRSNIDLKDKWRNLNFGAGQSSKDKIRIPNITGPTSSSSPSSQTLLLTGASTSVDVEKKLQDEKNPQKYDMMILQALFELNEPNGSEVTAIQGFIEQKHEVQAQPNFRRVLAAQLRRLVDTNKVEKVDNKCYKLIGSFARKIPASVNAATQNQEGPSEPLELEAPVSTAAALELAAAAAAAVADAEAKEQLAREHTMEAERISQMAEKTEALLMVAEEIYDLCSRGEIITVKPMSLE